MDKWICYVQTMEYYLALNQKEILPNARTWVNFENIMLNEKSQKDKYCMITFI